MSYDTIEDIYVKPDGADAMFARLKHLRGEEYEALLQAGVKAWGNDADPIRLAFAFGWLELRRRHPGLPFEEGVKHVLLDFSGEVETVAVGTATAPDPT